MKKNNFGLIELNPLIWELGHVAFFFEYHVLRHIFRYKCNLTQDFPLLLDYEEMKNIFDSFYISKADRFTNKTFKLNDIILYYNKTIQLCFNWLGKNKNDKISTYFILLGIMHNEMHNESFLFTRQLLNMPPPNNISYKPIKSEFINQLEFVKIPSGIFIQGSVGNDNISFDNEKPSFIKSIKSFLISQTCVTQLMYLNFIKDKGYQRKELWCNQGWQWIVKNQINKPLYWIKENNKWYRRYFDKKVPLEESHPVVNISWFEAKAFCKWIGGRLPSESEWEYVATNNGLTSEPNFKISGNLDYSGDTVPVDLFPYSDTNHKHWNGRGVIQMIGNVWEWCEDNFYPYDGFIIDPVYREFSYPFFGYKKILRGGCWAVPNELINSRYRNAQTPDIRHQFTGIRVAKDI